MNVRINTSWYYIFSLGINDLIEILKTVYLVTLVIDSRYFITLKCDITFELSIRIDYYSIFDLCYRLFVDVVVFVVYLSSSLLLVRQQ